VRQVRRRPVAAAAHASVLSQLQGHALMDGAALCRQRLGYRLGWAKREIEITIRRTALCQCGAQGSLACQLGRARPWERLLCLALEGAPPTMR
jgi:hypothetical protein